jgi:hypothetical protein
MQPPCTGVKLAGQVGVDDGGAGNDGVVQPTPLHGVGGGAVGSGGNEVSETGPVFARAVRHGTKRSAEAFAV